MNPDQNDRDRLLKFIEVYREHVAKRGLMYAGGLLSLEVLWHALDTFEDAVNGIDVFDPESTKNDPAQMAGGAYAAIAQKYKCGSWTLSDKVLDEFGGLNTREAADELVRRLQEVRELSRRMRNR